MGGARALIASLGASISLVAGATLSLLLISIVVAYPEFVGIDDGSGPIAPVTIAEQPPAALRAPSRRVREAPDAVTIRATSRPRRAERPARSVVRTRTAVSKPSFNPGIQDLTSVPPPPARPTPAPAAPPAPPVVGDGVREVGDVLSATLKETGAAAKAATAPLLGPPVSQAVQDALDVLTSVLEGTTTGLAGALDKTLPPPRQ